METPGLDERELGLSQRTRETSESIQTFLDKQSGDDNLVQFMQTYSPDGPVYAMLSDVIRDAMDPEIPSGSRSDDDQLRTRMDDLLRLDQAIDQNRDDHPEYHNHDHTRRVLHRCMELSEQDPSLSERDRLLDGITSILHDYNHGAEDDYGPFNHHEEYAGVVAARFLHEQTDCSPREALEVGMGITQTRLSMALGSDQLTDRGQRLHAADIGNVIQSEAEWFSNSMNLMAEMPDDQKPESFIDFLGQQQRFLNMVETTFDELEHCPKNWQDALDNKKSFLETMQKHAFKHNSVQETFRALRNEEGMDFLTPYDAEQLTEQFTDPVYEENDPSARKSQQPSEKSTGKEQSGPSDRSAFSM